LCRKFFVTPAGYHAWRRRKPSQQVLSNHALLVEIKRVHQESHECYGYPRVHAKLNQEGVVCGRHRVARLMRDNDIKGKKFRRYRKHRPLHHIADNSTNLLRKRDPVTSINQVWVGDITFIRVGDDWSYLSVVMDLYSRKILSWSFAPNRSAELVSATVRKAVKGNVCTPDTICHTDQGCEYTSHLYQDTLEEHQLRMSMSRKGHCWDNANMESFFHSLKTEMIYFNTFKTLGEAKSYIIDYMYFYNNERIHSGINYLTPVLCEKQVA
jgi:transposase InsO family protein